MTVVLVSDPGLSTSNAYISRSAANTYFADRENFDWLGLAFPEAEILKATQFLDERYYGQWRGRRTNEDQALAWPRRNVYDQDNYLIDKDTIPTVLARACAELALKMGQGLDLQPDLERGGKIERSRVRAGPVEVEEYFPSDAPAVTVVTKLDDMLKSLVTGGSSFQWLERA